MDDRHHLLHPAWAEQRGTGYDQLTDVDKQVWDRTRGLTHNHDSVAFWVQRISRAVTAGLITELDAELAIARVDKWMNQE